jgi:hypothetical protein
MTASQLIWYVAAGGTALLLLVCVSYWAVNYFIQQIGVRTHGRFREYLSHEVEVAIGLFREGICEQIVLQGKKSDSLAGLYAILIDLLRLGRELSATCAKSDPLQIEKAMRSLNETCTRFSELYQKESLHFSGEFYAILDGFTSMQKEVMQAMEKELYSKESTERSRDKEIRQNWLRFEDRIIGVMDLVRQEFHRRKPASTSFLMKGLADLPKPKIVPGAGTNP